MEKFSLSGTLTLNIEQEKNRLRMFVADGADELACHKITRKELDSFLQNTIAHLFKGRLQLDKNNEAIIVSVKGKEVGIVNAIDIFKKERN